MLVVVLISSLDRDTGIKDKPIQTFEGTADTEEENNGAIYPVQTPSVGVEYNSTSETMGQSNALRSAEAYLSTMPFSYSGLIQQLEYEGYSSEDATYGAVNCGADWSEQAAKSATSYLSMMAFSRDGLIEQLQYEGYTYEQAVYGAEANGY